MHPSLTIICSSFRSFDSLLGFICCMKLQTCQDFILQIINDEYDDELKNKIKPFLSPNMLWNEIVGPNNDYGYTGKNYMLFKTNTKYVSFSNHDNYYVPKYVELVLKNLNEFQLDFLFCKCITHNVDYLYDNFRINHPRVDNIDLGQFVVKTELAKMVGGFTPENRGMKYADGILCEKMLIHKPDIRIGEILNCLYVHN